MCVDDRFHEEDARRYCDKSRCPNRGGVCEREELCTGGLLRKLPVTPPEVPAGKRG